MHRLFQRVRRHHGFVADDHRDACRVQAERELHVVSVFRIIAALLRNVERPDLAGTRGVVDRDRRQLLLRFRPESRCSEQCSGNEQSEANSRCHAGLLLLSKRIATKRENGIVKKWEEKMGSRKKWGREKNGVEKKM